MKLIWPAFMAATWARASGMMTTEDDAGGVTRYQLAGIARSISHAVIARPSRPDGFLLAVFSFASDDVRERQVVREALKLHGFQKLAQNVYINGQMETAELEAVFEREGLTEHVYFFRCQEGDEPALRKKLTTLFDLPRRMQTLLQFQRDLSAFLEEPRLDGPTFARRYLYSGPVHYRITFTEEPPLPARALPAGYPIDSLETLMSGLANSHAGVLARYFRAVHK